MDFIRPDLLFSYWIFAWFFIYYIIDEFKGPKIIRRCGSPLLILWIALVFNIYELCYFMLVKLDMVLFVEYTSMILIIKALPIYLLYRKGVTIRLVNDVLVLFIVLLTYVAHLYLNHTNPQKVYAETENAIVHKENRTPMFYWMNKISLLIR